MAGCEQSHLAGRRLFGFLGIIAAAALTVALVHPTMRGPGTNYFTLPMGMILFALTAALLKNSRPARRTGRAVLLSRLEGSPVSLLLRNDGMTGDYRFTLHWRWKQTAEESMLATRKPDGAPAAAQADRAAMMTSALANPEWPGFRGADRAGHSSAPKIATGGAPTPPEQLWKIPG